MGIYTTRGMLLMLQETPADRVGCLGTGGQQKRRTHEGEFLNKPTSPVESKCTLVLMAEELGCETRGSLVETCWTAGRTCSPLESGTSSQERSSY